MSYSILSKATHGNILPFLMEMNRVSPYFIDKFLIEPMKEHVSSQKAGSKNDETPESILLHLLSKASLEDIDAMQLIYNKVKEANIQLSVSFFNELLSFNNIQKFNYILNDDLERTSKNIADYQIKTRGGYGSFQCGNSLFCIHKNDLDLAKKFFINDGDNIDNVISEAQFNHIEMLSQLQFDLDPSKSIGEYKIETYEKMLSSIFKDVNYDSKYENAFDRSRLLLFTNASDTYEKFMLENMHQMPENLIYKSLLIGLKDDHLSESALPKILKKLKITKNSLEYANLVTDSLDKKVNLKRFKKEFYNFPDSFWTESNLLEKMDDGLSRGMKMLLNLDLFYATWDSRSIEKAIDISEAKVRKHLPAIYKDYLDRRCFDLLEAQSISYKIISNSEGSGQSRYSLEAQSNLKEIVNDYVNVKNPQKITEDEMSRIENVIDLYLLKNKGVERMWVTSRLVSGSFPLTNLHKYPHTVFESLSDYKDIVINEIVRRDSAIDNNLVFFAMVTGLVSESDLSAGGFKLSTVSLNHLTHNDLKNKSLAEWVERNPDKISSDLILKTLSYQGVLTYDMTKKVSIMREELVLSELIPQVENKVKVNKY